ncbi:MAG: ATP-binding protein [Candidatus Nitrosocosmicus sp.]
MLVGIFEKFTTKSENGIGSGLYISKSIIKEHGGNIGTENNVDKLGGSSFYFTLPFIE